MRYINSECTRYGRAAEEDEAAAARKVPAVRCVPVKPLDLLQESGLAGVIESNEQYLILGALEYVFPQTMQEREHWLSLPCASQHFSMDFEVM